MAATRRAKPKPKAAPKPKFSTKPAAKKAPVKKKITNQEAVQRMKKEVIRRKNEAWIKKNKGRKTPSGRTGKNYA